MYLILAIVGVIIALVGAIYIFHLRDVIDILKEGIDGRDDAIKMRDDEIRRFRTQLTEATDKVESLRVENTAQAKALDDFQKTVEAFNKTKVEPKALASTQYPIAPVDITQKRFGRDNKGHFTKRK